MLSHTHYAQYLLTTVARHTNIAWPNSSILYHLTPPPPTCQGFDAWALEQACWAVLVVPVVSVPAVVDAIVELLLDIHMFKLWCHRRHLDPSHCWVLTAERLNGLWEKPQNLRVRGKKRLEMCVCIMFRNCNLAWIRNYSRFPLWTLNNSKHT